MGVPLSPVAVEVARGRVWRLGGDVELDGRISWFPANVRGRKPVNSYLVRGSGSAVLIDTNVRVHEQLMLRQLRSLVEPGTPMAIVLTRTEMDCCLNIPAIEEEFDVRSVFFVGGITVPASKAQVQRLPLAEGQSLTIEPVAGLPMRLVAPRLRLLPTVWVHEPVSKVLFTSDSFCHAMAAAEGQGPVITDVGQADDAEEVESQLMTKLAWMRKTDTGVIRDDFLEIFADLEVEVLAPGHGRPFSGRAVIDRQRDLIADVISRVGAHER